MDHIEFFESLYQKDYDESIQRQKKYVESFGSEDGYPKLDGYPKYDDIYLKISNYDINKFDLVDLGYTYHLMPDKEFIFLINELDSIYGRPINPPHALLWIIPVSNENINEINFTEFIPQYAQGILVYKIYKLIISKFKYITAIEYQITKMYGIWCGLMADRDLYHFVSIKKSGVIDKKISNSELVICLDKIKHLNAKFDSDLENKIIEFYGNLEFFKSDS